MAPLPTLHTPRPPPCPLKTSQAWRRKGPLNSCQGSRMGRVPHDPPFQPAVPRNAEVTPSILSSLRRKDESLPLRQVHWHGGHRPKTSSSSTGLAMPALLQEHDDCLQLPIGVDRLWLLLPSSKRPQPQELWRIAHESGVDHAVAMALAMFGNEGPQFLASLRSAASPRPPTSSRPGSSFQAWRPASVYGTKRPATVLVPLQEKNVPLHTQPVPSGQLSYAPVLLKRRVSFHDDVVQNSCAGTSGTQALETSQKRHGHDAREITQRTLHDSGPVSSRTMKSAGLPTPACAGDDLPVLELTGLSGSSASQKSIAHIIDERVVALAALASEARPAHRTVAATNVDFTDLQMFAMWTELRRLQIVGGSVRSLRGIENCVNIQHLELSHCECLEELLPITNCTKLRSIELKHCHDLGSIKVLLNLPSLTNVRLDGCTKLGIAEVTQLYQHVAAINAGSNSNYEFLFPNFQMANACARQLPPTERMQLLKDARESAQAWLQDIMASLVEAMRCDAVGCKRLADELLVALEKASEFGIPSGALQAARDAHFDANAIIHVREFSNDQRKMLAARTGRRGPARLRRCFVLIRWLKIRRLEGLLRVDFVALLRKEFSSETETNLHRIFNFIDVYRVGVLRMEDFARLGEGFSGPATGEVVDRFRLWAYEKYGGILGLFHALTNQATYDEDLSFDDFRYGLQRLGWDGEILEIWCLLSDHKPKTSDVGAAEFQSLDQLFLFQVQAFTQWMGTAHGSWQKAFAAIDQNKSEKVSTRELVAFFERLNSLPVLHIEDRVKALKLVDFFDTHIISKKNFEILASLDIEQLFDDLVLLNELCVGKYGSLRHAFRRFCAMPAPANFSEKSATKKSKAAARQVRIKSRSNSRARKQGQLEVHPEVFCFAQFNAALNDIDFKPITDLRLLFRYLDMDMADAITWTEWSVLPTLAAASEKSRACFQRVRDFLQTHYGSFEDAFSALARMAKQREEARAKEARRQVQRGKTLAALDSVM